MESILDTMIQAWSQRLIKFNTVKILNGFNSMLNYLKH